MKLYKVMCWDSIDPKFNIHDLTEEEAGIKLAELESKRPDFTFEIYPERPEWYERFYLQL